MLDDDGIGLFLLSTIFFFLGDFRRRDVCDASIIMRLTILWIVWISFRNMS